MTRSLTYLLLTFLLSTQAAYSQVKRKVAVLPFKGNRDIVEVLPDMVSTNLAKSNAIILLERTQIDKALENFRLERESGVVDTSTAVEVGKWLGADRVVLGSVFSIQGESRIDIRVVDVNTGVVEETATASGRDIFSLVDIATAKLIKLVDPEYDKPILSRDFTVTYQDVDRRAILYQHQDQISSEYDFTLQVAPMNICNVSEIAWFKRTPEEPFITGFELKVNDLRIAEFLIDGLSGYPCVVRRTRVGSGLDVVVSNCEVKSVEADYEDDFTFSGVCVRRSGFIKRKWYYLGNAAWHIEVRRR